MKLQHLSSYAIALAAVITGAVALGAPIWMLLPLVLLACPLMMFMMGGHRGDHDHAPLRNADNSHREHSSERS